MLLLRSSLSCQSAALAHLDSILPYDLVLWTDSSVPFGKSAFGILAKCSLCGTETTLSLSAGPVCSSFSAEACTIKQALCWSRQHQQVCHFSFFLFSSYMTLILSSSPCFLLRLSCYLNVSGRNCLFSSPVLSGYNGCPGTRFFWETVQLMSWPAVFPSNAKKVRICEIMSDGFAVKIQQGIKKVWRFLVTFSLC